MPRGQTDEIFDETVQGLGLAGRVCAITGSTSGTGFFTAVAALRGGAACIVLLNRPSPRAEKAREELQGLAGGATEIIPVDCDLQSFECVRAAAAIVAAETIKRGGLDVLACNAGIMAVGDARTVDGFDVQMQTNHLSHFLLTKLLMPALEAAASSRGEARVVQHSSGARKPNKRRPGSDNLVASHFERCEPGSLGGDGLGACFGRYHQSKLSNTCFAMALHARLSAKQSKVKSCCAEPGVAATSRRGEPGVGLGMKIRRERRKSGGGEVPFLMWRRQSWMMRAPREWQAE